MNRYCLKRSNLAVVSVESAKYCAGEARYRMSVVLPFSVTTTLPLAATEAMPSVAWFWLNPFALLMSAVTVRLLDPATATLTTLLTPESTGASDPPAYVPDSDASENGNPDCGVMNPKVTAESVPRMNA